MSDWKKETCGKCIFMDKEFDCTFKTTEDTKIFDFLHVHKDEQACAEFKPKEDNNAK
jgi:hypothetical protein